MRHLFRIYTIALLVTHSESSALPTRTPISTTNLKCVGLAASDSRELVVVGTAHTPCRSAAEVEKVISSAKPDVVVLELDQERLERLLCESPADRKYGADFAAAAYAATAIGAPIILGDVKARTTVASLRALGPLADVNRVWRAIRLAFGGSSTDNLRVLQPASIAGSLYDDPAKLLPLLAGLWWIVLLSGIAALTMPATAAASVDAGAEWLNTFASALTTVADVAALALAARVWDVLLLSRDDALASSTLRGLELARSLKAGTLLRRRYTFGTDPLALADAPLHPQGTLPFFTLKRPLAPGEVRRLNLFEPRWLCLLDALAAESAEDEGVPVLNAASDDPSRLLNASFGCVFAVNRIYTPPAPKGKSFGEFEGGDPWWEADKDARPERVADVVLRPFARRARVVRAEASTRPVSGDRRMEVWIKGEEPLKVDESSLAPTAGGYLAARVSECTEAEYAAPSEDDVDDAVRVVSVVGLAHANGVLQRCASRALEDAEALTRTIPADEREWVGY